VYLGQLEPFPFKRTLPPQKKNGSRRYIAA
jgi:hypothetical protein